MASCWPLPPRRGGFSSHFVIRSTPFPCRPVELAPTATVIPLLVTPDDGELLALAAKEGRLQLALRNTLDTLSVSTSGARADRLSPSAASSSQNSRPQRNRAAAP